MRPIRGPVTGLAIFTLLSAIVAIPAEATAASVTSPGWSLVSSPNQPHASLDFLNGVSCGATKLCVAAGFSEKGSGPDSVLLEQWNGAKWSLMHAPSIGFPAELRHVSCSSATFCMAVGFVTVPGDRPQPLTMSWNGHVWATVSVPAVAGADEGEINGVQCFSKIDCVAAGWTNDGSMDSALIPRYNGHSWNLTTVDNETTIVDVNLASISCSTRTWCVAVGTGNVGIAITSTDQTTWTASTALKLPAAESGFYGVSCTGKKTCVVFGWGAPVLNKDFKWVVESGNGNKWKESTTPQRTGFPVGLPNDISCEAGQCTIVGEFTYGFTAKSKFTPLIMTWNGHKLSTLKSASVPGLPDTGFGGVTCRGSTCWAVGAKAPKGNDFYKSLIERS